MQRSHVVMNGRDLKEFIEANAGVDFSFSRCFANLKNFLG